MINKKKRLLTVFTIALGFILILSLSSYFNTEDSSPFVSNRSLLFSLIILILIFIALLISSVAFIRLYNSESKAEMLSSIKRQASEQISNKLKQVFTQAPVAICLLRGNKYVVEVVNKKMLEMWGISEDQVINTPLFNALPTVAGQGLEELLNGVYKTGIAFEAKEMHIAVVRNGVKETLYLNFVYEPFYNEESKIDGIMCVATDVTERVLSRNKIEESQKLYHNLIYSSPSAIGILEGEKLIITMANEAILKIWGKGKNVFGKPYFEILPELADQGYRKIFDQVYNTGEVFNAVETPVEIIQDGVKQLHYYNFILFPQRNVSNVVVGIGIIATEVTLQAESNKKIKESEESFRTLAQTLPQLIWVTDEKGNAEFASSRWEEYSGIEPKGENEWKQLVHPDDYDDISKAWIHSLETSNHYSFNVRLKNKAGAFRWHKVEAEPILNETGNVYKWIGAFSEIHEEKTFAEKLKKEVEKRTHELNIANKLLENNNDALAKMNKELQSFAYISSHDLQEPLRKIQTFVSRIMEKEFAKMSDNSKDDFTRMHLAAKRMQTLIDDLLAYSRTTTSQRKLEKKNLNLMVNEVKEDLKEEIKEANATIETTEMGELSIIPFQFRQLLHNLIGNSLKFAKENLPIVINISSEIAEGKFFHDDKLVVDKKYCHITFSDNGIGFDPRYNEKIFEVFQRLHGKAQYDGTGIGLSIVKKIVDNHEGVIYAKGELNKGATFNIFIPAFPGSN
jgi:PAS domain S-box-containing protein